jgi:transaldolase
VRYNASDIEVVNRIDRPVDPKIVDELLKKFPDFRRAYSEDGLTVDEFDTYPCTVRTLRQFNGACTDLAGLIRDVMLPNPDKK